MTIGGVADTCLCPWGLGSTRAVTGRENSHHTTEHDISLYNIKLYVAVKPCLASYRSNLKLVTKNVPSMLGLFAVFTVQFTLMFLDYTLLYKLYGSRGLDG